MITQFLADTSALTRLLRSSPQLGWDEQIASGLVGVCPATELEMLFSARSKEDRDRILDKLNEGYPWVPMPDNVFRRATQVQTMLTERGEHRSAGPVDLLVAATAELSGLTLLHHDRDFEVLAKATGQPVAWLTLPGSVN